LTYESFDNEVRCQKTDTGRNDFTNRGYGCIMTIWWCVLKNRKIKIFFENEAALHITIRGE